MRASRSTLLCVLCAFRLGYCAQADTEPGKEATPAAQSDAPFPPPSEWETQWKKQWADKWQANQVEREQEAMEPVNVERANKIAELQDQEAQQAQLNFDLLLYGGLAVFMLGVPAAIWKLCCTGSAPSGLSNVVTVQRAEEGAAMQSRGMAPPPPGGFPGGMAMRGAPQQGGPAPPQGGAPAAHARYNTEQLRQTVARLRAQV